MHVHAHTHTHIHGTHTHTRTHTSQCVRRTITTDLQAERGGFSVFSVTSANARSNHLFLSAALPDSSSVPFSPRQQHLSALSVLSVFLGLSTDPLFLAFNLLTLPRSPVLSTVNMSSVLRGEPRRLSGSRHASVCLRCVKLGFNGAQGGDACLHD